MAARQIYVINNQNAKQAAKAAIDAIGEDDKYCVEIRRYRSRRTLAQNNLLWMWLTHLEEYTGYTKTELYDMFCDAFLGYDQSEIGDKVIMKLRSTSKLNTKQFSEFLNEIDRFAASVIGVGLPHPEDVYYEALGRVA